MIKIAGNIRRSFIFPAEIDVAYDFYADLGNIFRFLPHISVAEIYNDRHFRMLYESVELGGYQVYIVSDIDFAIDRPGYRLSIFPLDGVEPVVAKARRNGCLTQGTFGFHSTFISAGRQTRIEYGFDLQADLPPPLGLRLVPGSMVERISTGIAHKRMREIAEGFIENSIHAFLNEKPGF